MKTQLIITTIIASAMMFGSCTEDLNVEPDAQPQATEITFEEAYLLAIRVETQLKATEFNDRPRGGNVLSLTGEGIAFSNTFGPMDVETNLEYEVELGRVSGIITLTVRNTDQQLQLRIEEKHETREWGDLSGSCLPATSTQPFADLNFTGEMCIKYMPEHLRDMDDNETSVFLIEGSLK